jgi:type I phosphodiesterase/nucleotide pyrophosphatase
MELYFEGNPAVPMPSPSVLILVADGLRPDILTTAIDRGDVPALAAMAGEGQLTTVTSVFPSVTGVAYTPFVMGRFPGAVGLPGLRWFDRSRHLSALTGYSRSYMGVEARRVDADLDPRVPTLFELAPKPALGAMSIITRGLPGTCRLGQGARFVARVGWTHFRGDLTGWRRLDREIGDELVERIRRDRPPFVFAAFTATDKVAHARGPDSKDTLDALRTLDSLVARIRHDAEEDGRWRKMQLWVVSDHGHAPVDAHDDLARFLALLGIKVRAHPWMLIPGGDVAVMVSGNAMAHVYLELWRRHRPFWPELRGRWNHVAGELQGRPSIDLVILPHSSARAEVRSCGRGTGIVERHEDRYTYHPVDGDPLGIGPVRNQSAAGALEATATSRYPDAIVQIASLIGAERAGDVIVSAARGWDFREGYEPIPHRSSHGSLRREHMSVPLLMNHRPRRLPQRTVDIMPSALRALGVGVQPGLDGVPFL